MRASVLSLRKLALRGIRKLVLVSTIARSAPRVRTPALSSEEREKCTQRVGLNYAVGLIAMVLIFAGCAVGPAYHRPEVKAPQTFRGQEGEATNSMADLPWWEIFHDEALQALVRTALTNNYDLRIAVARMDQAQALASEARAGLLPQVNYGVTAARGKNVGSGNSPAPTGTSASVFSGDINASWDVDLSGRVRRMTEAAHAEYFASQEARRDVSSMIVAQVAQDYFQLLALDRELEIAKETTNSFGRSLKLFTQRLEGGIASKLETSSAEALMDSAAATIPELERQVAMQENQLSILLSINPGAILRAKISLENELPPEVPAGLPSALLERRPDIRQAEQLLRAANAHVGVAQANFLPQLSLTALFGRVSPEVSVFTGGGATAWGVGAGLVGPIFQGGKLKAEYKRTVAARNQSALQYQSAVLYALQQVSDALVSREKLAEARVQRARGDSLRTSG